MTDISDLTIPEFLRRKPPAQESDMSHHENARTAEYTQTPDEGAKMAEKIREQMQSTEEQPKTETTQMLEQAMAQQSSPTVEDVIGAIRKLTVEIDDKTATRAALRAKLRKMAGEI